MSSQPSPFSLRQLAAVIGVNEKAIRKALAVGVFSPASVRRDEHGAPCVVNVQLATDDWTRSGRRVRGLGAGQAKALRTVTVTLRCQERELAIEVPAATLAAWALDVQQAALRAITESADVCTHKREE